MWWLGQPKEAQDALKEETKQLPYVLQDFRHWYDSYYKSFAGLEERSKPLLWSNGVAEDCVWLASAYKAAGHIQPWSFREQRCYRTLKSLFPSIQGEPGEAAHNALADASWQAQHLKKLLKHIGEM